MAEHQLFKNNLLDKVTENCGGENGRLRESVNFDDPRISTAGKPASLPSLALDTGEGQHARLPDKNVETILNGDPSRFFPKPEPHWGWKDDLVGSAFSGVGNLVGKWLRELYIGARPDMIKSCRYIGKEALAVKHEFDSFVAEVEKPDQPVKR
jgi:hypothetical protein